MGFFSRLFKGPEIDMEKSNANAKKMRALFNQVVEDGDHYRLIFGYTEDVSRKGVDSKTANSQDSLWITRPERNLGSNHVVFGGMILPLSAISISCFMETG